MSSAVTKTVPKTKNPQITANYFKALGYTTPQFFWAVNSLTGTAVMSSTVTKTVPKTKNPQITANYFKALGYTTPHNSVSGFWDNKIPLPFLQQYCTTHCWQKILKFLPEHADSSTSFRNLNCNAFSNTGQSTSTICSCCVCYRSVWIPVTQFHAHCKKR